MLQAATVVIARASEKIIGLATKFYKQVANLTTGAVERLIVHQQGFFFQ